MEDWLNLINAETEGELMDIQQTTTIPEVQDTIVLLRELSADEKVRMEAFYREKRLHDEASAMGGALKRGIEIGKEEGIEIGREEGIEIGREEGRAEGKLEGFIELVKNGLLTVSQAAETLGIIEAEFEEKMKR